MAQPLTTVQYSQLLTHLIMELFRERGQIVSAPTAESDKDPEKLWPVFRALVNTREPNPASPEFLAEQDKLLTSMIEADGVVPVSRTVPVPGNPRLRVWQGDIVDMEADGIVNAANSEMLGCWIPGHNCIDNQIHTFAGVQLRIKCAEIMQAQGFKEPVGLAKVTPAYNLPARYVIHTVGPQIAEGARPTADDRDKLKSCYRSCLDAALAHDMKSIVFCGISTGVFGFPAKEAARIATGEVTRWLEEHPDVDITVVFDTYEDADWDIYVKQLKMNRGFV